MKQYISIRSRSFGMKFKSRNLLLNLCLLPLFVSAQMPVCIGTGNGIIYSVNESGTSIYNYDPSLPPSSTNPSVNTISLGNAHSTLAICENLNAAGPSPTFYSVVDSGGSIYYCYYNGTSWVNTGHTIGGVVGGIGGGGGFIYNLSADNVYQYNGTGNATLLITLPPGTQITGDIAVDCAGNFYILNAWYGGGWLKEFNSSGGLVNSWTTSGLPYGDAGGSLAIIGNQVYSIYGTLSGPVLLTGTISNSSSNINFSYVSSPFSVLTTNFASCPFGNAIVAANTDTAYYNCGSGLADSLSASGIGPFSWAVLSGPAIINGAGDSVTVSSTGLSTIVLSTSAFAPCANTDTVTVIPYISPPTMNSNSPVCENGNLVLGIGNLPAGATYSWTGPGGFASANQNATVYNIQLADSGYYTVRDSLNGCVSSDSILVSVLQSPLTPQASHNTPCAGDSLGLAVNSPQAGCTFSWSGPQGFNANAEDTFIAHAQSGNAGNYILTAHLNGCATPDTTLVSVTPTAGPPIIQIAGVPTDTMCIGGSLSLDATATNAGSAPSYQWKKNGSNIIGATNASYTTSGLSNGDIMSCEVRGNATCQPVDTTISAGLYIHVLQLSPPTLSLSIFPLIYTNGQLVTFSSHIPAGSTGISYQWTRNGVDIAGATQPTFSSTSLSLNDTICLIIHDNLQCTVPDSVIACVELTNGVSSLQPLVSNLTVWPNPVTNQLFIEGVAQGTTISIYNIVGQRIYMGQINQQKTLLDTKGFANGAYILELINNDGERVIRKIVKE